MLPTPENTTVQANSAAMGSLLSMTFPANKQHKENAGKHP